MCIFTCKNVLQMHMAGNKQRAENLSDQQVYDELLIRCLSFRKIHSTDGVLVGGGVGEGGRRDRTGLCWSRDGTN